MTVIWRDRQVQRPFYSIHCSTTIISCYFQATLATIHSCSNQ